MRINILPCCCPLLTTAAKVTQQFSANKYCSSSSWVRYVEQSRDIGQSCMFNGSSDQLACCINVAHAVPRCQDSRIRYRGCSVLIMAPGLVCVILRDIR